MGRYPELEVALPATYVSPSRTARILKPGIVLGTVLLLGSMSLVGVAVAGSVFSSPGPHTKSTNATQAFALIASFLSFAYVILHGIAAKYNEPVGVVRPPELRLHAACFILARVGLVMWFVTFVSACTVVSKPNVCMSEAGDCELQVADIVASILACISTGVILTALESCKYPFQAPDFFHITKKITFRINGVGEEFPDRSVSRPTSFEEQRRGGGSNLDPNLDEKPLPRPPSAASDGAPDRPVTPLLPLARRKTTQPHSRAWGEEWTHGSKNKERQKRALANSDSAISLSYDEREERSSSGYLSSSDHSSSYVPTAKRSPKRSTIARRNPRPRTVTPSSSISNISRRSPLSTMRSVEFPDVVVRPDMRYFPPTAGREWRDSRAISQLLPTADINNLQRRSSMAASDQFYVRRPNKTLPLTRPQIRRRNTSDLRLSGAYADYKPNFDMERNLEEHMQMIEVEYVTRNRNNSGRRQQYQQPQPSPIPQSPMELPPNLMPQPVPPPNLTPNVLEKPLQKAILRVRSRSRYREPKPQVFPAVPTKEERPSTAHPVGRERVQLSAKDTTTLRRLSLGDISSGLGKMFD